MILGSGLIQSANTFVGAYDAIPSIAAAYSTRRLLSSYTGPLLRLVADRAGYPEQDIGYTAAGDLDTVAAATFLDGDSGYVTKWYDQSGSNDAAQAVLANMPLYVASGQNSKPVMRGNGTSTFLPFTWAFIANSNYGFLAMVTRRSATGIYVGGSTLSTNENMTAGWTLDTRYNYSQYGNDLNWTVSAYSSPVSRIFYHQLSATGRILRSAGVQVGTIPTTTQVSSYTGAGFFSRGGGAWFSNADLGEVIAFSSDLSSGNISAAEAAANAYWSVY